MFPVGISSATTMSIASSLLLQTFKKYWGPPSLKLPLDNPLGFFFSLNTAISLSFSSYATYSSPLDNAVALHWTLSSASVYFLYWGDQTWTRYSWCICSLHSWSPLLQEHASNLLATCPPPWPPGLFLPFEALCPNLWDYSILNAGFCVCFQSNLWCSFACLALVFHSTSYFLRNSLARYLNI